jgi:hypothetical protein
MLTFIGYDPSGRPLFRTSAGDVVTPPAPVGAKMPIAPRTTFPNELVEPAPAGRTTFPNEAVDHGEGMRRLQELERVAREDGAMHAAGLEEDARYRETRSRDEFAAIDRDQSRGVPQPPIPRTRRIGPPQARRGR